MIIYKFQLYKLKKKNKQKCTNKQKNVRKLYPLITRQKQIIYPLLMITPQGSTLHAAFFPLFEFLCSLLHSHQSKVYPLLYYMYNWFTWDGSPITRHPPFLSILCDLFIYFWTDCVIYYYVIFASQSFGSRFQHFSLSLFKRAIPR